MRRQKRVLITGASGFVGSHLVPYLHDQGFEIWASYHRHKRSFPFPVHWIQADLTCLKDSLELTRRSRPDYVFHLVGQPLPGASWRDPSRTLQLNTVASLCLFEGMVRFAPQARVVLASSSHVYGRSFFKRGRVQEKNRTEPMSPYGVSKLLMELAAQNYFKRHGLFPVIVRAFNQVGTGQSPHFVFSDFCRQVALMERGKKPPLLNVGDLRIVRDFISIGDAVRAYQLLAQKGRRGEIYNLGSGKGVCLQAVVDFLRKESRVPFAVKKVSTRVQPQEISCALADASKLKRLGWRPRESVWEVLRELLQEWREKVR